MRLFIAETICGVILARERVFFSAANFPGAIQPFIQALPLTALIDSLRAVVLEGATVGDISGELALLGAWAVIPFSLAMALFRWR